MLNPHLLQPVHTPAEMQSLQVRKDPRVQVADRAQEEKAGRAANELALPRSWHVVHRIPAAARGTKRQLEHQRPHDDSLEGKLLCQVLRARLGQRIRLRRAPRTSRVARMGPLCQEWYQLRA